jgi:hypothetical protein
LFSLLLLTGEFSGEESLPTSAIDSLLSSDDDEFEKRGHLKGGGGCCERVCSISAIPPFFSKYEYFMWD